MHPQKQKYFTELNRRLENIERYRKIKSKKVIKGDRYEKTCNNDKNS